MNVDHTVVPLQHLPRRTELWTRNQLALSLLAHRPYDRETSELVQRVLRGELTDPSKEDQ